MKKFIIPFIITLTFHAVLVYGNFDFFKKNTVKPPEIIFMTMTLAHVEAPQPEKKPRKKIIKKKKKVSPKKPKKKIVQEKKEISKQKIVKKIDEKKETIEEPRESREEAEVTKGAVAQVQKASPLYSHNPSPRYPRSARQRGWQGVVEIEVVVDISGNVKSLKVVKTSGYSILDRSALKTVKGWRFSPGKKGNIQVEMAVIVPVRFSLS